MVLLLWCCAVPPKEGSIHPSPPWSPPWSPPARASPVLTWWFVVVPNKPQTGWVLSRAAAGPVVAATGVAGQSAGVGVGLAKGRNEAVNSDTVRFSSVSSCCCCGSGSEPHGGGGHCLLLYWNEHCNRYSSEPLYNKFQARFEVLLLLQSLPIIKNSHSLFVTS